MGTPFGKLCPSHRHVNALSIQDIRRIRLERIQDELDDEVDRIIRFFNENVITVKRPKVEILLHEKKDDILRIVTHRLRASKYNVQIMPTYEERRYRGCIPGDEKHYEMGSELVGRVFLLFAEMGSPRYSLDGITL